MEPYMTRSFNGAAFFMAYCLAQKNYGSHFPNDGWPLHHALKAVIDGGDVPEFISSRLRFVDSNIGLECVELPAMTKNARISGIIRDLPDWGFTRSQARISEEVARRMLREYENHEEITAFASKVYEQHLLEQKRQEFDREYEERQRRKGQGRAELEC